MKTHLYIIEVQDSLVEAFTKGNLSPELDAQLLTLMKVAIQQGAIGAIIDPAGEPHEVSK